MAVWTVLYEINGNITIIIMNYFVQKTTLRTELGFTVVHLGFQVPRGRDRCEKKNRDE